MQHGFGELGTVGVRKSECGPDHKNVISALSGGAEDRTERPKTIAWELSKRSDLVLCQPSQLEIRYRLLAALGCAFPLSEVLGDDFHPGHQMLVQAGIAGKIPVHAFAFAAKHVTHALQLKNEPVDFLCRCVGDAQNERILVFDAATGVRIDLGALLTWESRIAPEDVPDRALDIRRCLINICEIFRNITTYDTPPVW